MSFDHDDISNTSLGIGLDLGLGLHDDCMKRESQKKKEDGPSKSNNKVYPSLTLGPIIGDDEENNDPLLASKIEVSSSSLSNSSSIVKKERDMSLGEEFEVPSRACDDHIDHEDHIVNPIRKKLRLTKEQSAALEDNFKENSTLNSKLKQELATKLNLRARQVEVWFQNRRARTKLKQTESECELMKKYCETLTQENKRLKTELQELKSMKGVGPMLYMQQIPPSPATLSMCPSCDTILCANKNNINGFYRNSFIHSTAHRLSGMLN